MIDSNPPHSLLPELRALGLFPRKSLGQHYLSDARILAGIVEAAELSADAIVIEVGPGPGTLTAALLPHVGRLVAIELDDTLANMLARHFQMYAQFYLIQGDALQIAPVQALAQTGGIAPYFFVANVPYYITSALLRHFLEADPAPIRSVLTLQLDVARRIVAAPPQMSLLAVSVQVYALPRIVRQLAPGSFYPPPKVTSAVLRLDARPQPLIAPHEREWFFDVVRAGFGQKRKTLRNSLSAGLGLPAAEIESVLLSCGLEPRQRAQELHIEQWLALAAALG